MEVSAALQAGGATPAGAMPKPPAVLAARVQALAQAEARADAAAAQVTPCGLAIMIRTEGEMGRIAGEAQSPLRF
jgi:hypothetical protein